MPWSAVRCALYSPFADSITLPNVFFPSERDFVPGCEPADREHAHASHEQVNAHKPLFSFPTLDAIFTTRRVNPRTSAFTYSLQCQNVRSSSGKRSRMTTRWHSLLGISSVTRRAITIQDGQVVAYAFAVNTVSFGLRVAIPPVTPPITNREPDTVPGARCDSSALTKEEKEKQS